MSLPQNVITVTTVLPLSPLPCHPLGDTTSRFSSMPSGSQS